MPFLNFSTEGKRIFTVSSALLVLLYNSKFSIIVRGDFVLWQNIQEILVHLHDQPKRSKYANELETLLSHDVHGDD